MENNASYDTSIFDSDDITSASIHDGRDNENNINSMHDISSAEIVEFGNSGSANISDDTNNTNPVSSIVDESNDVVGIDEKHDRHSEDISAIEVASKEIGLINSNYDSKNSGCDVLDNNNSNDVMYDSLLNHNVCIVFDDNNKRIEEEASILIEELTRRSIEANSMHSGDEFEEDGEEIVNIGNINIRRPTLENDTPIDDIPTLRDGNGYNRDENITCSDGNEPTDLMEIEFNSDDNVTTGPVQITVSSDFDPNNNPVNVKLDDILDEPYLDSCLISDPSEYNENEGFNENAVDQDTEPIREEVFRQIYLHKKKENIDIYNDEVFADTEVFSNGTDTPHIPTLSTSEIIVLFPHLRTPSGKTISMSYGDNHTVRSVRSETEFNIPFRGEKPIRTLSTSTFELLAQKYLMRGRFVSGVMSLNGVQNDNMKKWCYILRNSEECKDKQWRYNVMVDKQPCQLSFQVIEDPTAVERWETSTFELMNKTTEKVQFESEWVLINCSPQDIEMFTAHQNEVIELSYKQEPDESVVEKSCAVS